MAILVLLNKAFVSVYMYNYYDCEYVGNWHLTWGNSWKLSETDLRANRQFEHCLPK